MAHHSHHHEDKKKHEKHDKHHDDKKHHGGKEDRRVPPSVGGFTPSSRKQAEIDYLKHHGKKLNHGQKKFQKEEEKRRKEEKKRENTHEYRKGERDTSSYKLPQGRKYSHLQRFQTLNQQQKDILKNWGKKQPVEEFEEPGLMKKGMKFLDRAVENGPPTSPIEQTGLDFLRQGMQNGPPISPVETAGGNFLQRLLGETPQNMLKDFEQPYMRQFREQIAPEIAEKYVGAGNARGSGFQSAMMNAGAGLSENLASLKGNLINQLLGQQIQGANVGLGYSQLPGQRYGQQQQNANIAMGYAQLPSQRWQQQLQATQMGIPASMIPQQQQQEMNRYATNADFARQQQIMGTQPWGQILTPPRGKSPSFWQGALPRIGSAIQGAAMGAAVGRTLGSSGGRNWRTFKRSNTSGQRANASAYWWGWFWGSWRVY